MHKSVLKAEQKLISRRALKKAFKWLEPLGLFYRGRRAFWSKQVGIIALYLQDKEIDSRVLNCIHKFMQELDLVEKELPNKVAGVFACSGMNMTLYSPCQNKQCPFWGDYISRLNCIHHYLSDQKRDGLSVAEMGIMSGFSRVHINNVLNEGLKIIRTHALTDLKEESYEQKIEVLRLDGVCVVCGKETEHKVGLFSSEFDAPKTYSYCSFECYKSKPPTCLFLEESLGVSIGEVLASLPKRYSDIEDAASCLTIAEEALKHLLWTKAPTHTFLEDERRPQIEIRVNGRKSWERETRKLKEKMVLLSNLPQPLFAAAREA